MRKQLAEFAPSVYRFLLRSTGNIHLSEDLTQETMLRAWRARQQLRDPDRMRVWLLRIANNAWYDHQRRNRPQTFATIPESLTPIQESHVADVVDREHVEMALEAMEDLPPRQREVLHLAVCEHLSIAEIADVLEIEAGTVKSNLSLARQKMRSRLKSLLPDESRSLES